MCKIKCDAVKIKSQNLISKYRYIYIYRVPDNKYNIAHRLSSWIKR